MSFSDDARTLIQSENLTEETKDLLEDTIDALLGNPVSAGKVIITLAKSPFMLREKLFWAKMENYLNGVFLSEKDCSKLRAILMEEGTCTENAKRLIECIDRAETLRKVQYLINATRCLLVSFIDRTTFFRICHAVAGTIDEDLIYLREHISEDELQYSDSIQGLYVSGLVTFSAIGGSETLYSFTRLAKLVDQYAISYDDVLRYPNPNIPAAFPSSSISIQNIVVDQGDDEVLLIR